MWLLIIYPVVASAGTLIAILLGLYLDTVFPAFSLPIALGLFFGALVLTWPPSVWITERWLPQERSEDDLAPNAFHSDSDRRAA